MKSDLWIEEKCDNIMGLKFKVEKTLFSGQSEFQSVDVVETKGHGKMLLNDGLVMLSERDEFVYHDMIAHLPLFVHPCPENVLIIGGGDGATARETFRHHDVKRCVMVEIDKMVVHACKEFIPSCSCELDNPKLDLIIGDGVKFAKETKEKFDVILIDSTDPIGPAQPLFGEEFYRDIHNCLNDNGIVVSQGESPWYQNKMQNKLMSIKSKLFDVVSVYNFSNLTYPGGLWSFTFASKGLHPIKDFKEEKVSKSGLKFKYYNESIHKAAFALPQFQKENVQEFVKG